MRDVTGVHNPLSGNEGKIRKTATEIISLIQEANQRIKLKIQINELGPLHDQARMMFDMETQFTDEKLMVKVYDNGTYTASLNIDPSKLKFDGEFKLQVASQFGIKELKAQRTMEFMQMAGSAPGMEEKIDWEVLLKMVANSFDMNVGDIFIEPSKEEKKVPEASAPNLSLVPPQGGAPAGMAAPDAMGQMMPPQGGAPPELLPQGNVIPPEMIERYAQKLQADARAAGGI